MQTTLSDSRNCVAHSRSSAKAQRRCVLAGKPSRKRLSARCSSKEVTLLDYGAGNVRSVRNALKKLGYTVKDVTRSSDIIVAKKLIFPGVGNYGQAMKALADRCLVGPLMEYILTDRPFLGICLGLQLLFDGSDENGGWEGLGIIPGRVQEFDTSLGLPVPHIGWNDITLKRDSSLLSHVGDKRLYFVHSFRGVPSEDNKDWVLATSNYGGEFVAAVQKGNVCATQFHPEKSSTTGLEVIRNFMEPELAQRAAESSEGAKGLAKRVIACLDVRSNDNGDLVVTKGDQYDVREKGGDRDVKNLGKPVDLAARYFDEGADEVTFLNITAFRDSPLADTPMLEVLRQASEKVFVPLTVGGGIKGFKDSKGRTYSALQVANEYFRSGADKISIGSDAVEAAEALRARGGVKDGSTSIEQISDHYGKQAVVVSIDPRRVYVSDPASVKHATVKTSKPGPNGEQYCWWQCTVKGGREGRDIGAVEVAKAVETLGAGEILLNCIDNDGAGQGFDLELVDAVSKAVTIPVIASSGAGKPEHFTEVFNATGASAALAAGIFHRREVPIVAVKKHMSSANIPTRM